MATKLFENLAHEGETTWPAERHVDQAVELFRACGTRGVASVLARAAERIAAEPGYVWRGTPGAWLRTKAIYEAVRDEHGSFLDDETPNSQMLIKVRALELLRRAKEALDKGSAVGMSAFRELVDELYPLYETHILTPKIVTLAVPVDVAHDMVAFGECHCGEPIGGGETDESYKPCLYCAARSALHSATGDAMYASDKPSSEASA